MSAVTLCRATVGGPLSRPPNPYRCVQVWSGVHCKKIGANRHPPAYAAETTTSLSPCSLSASPPKRVGASLVRHRDASREYFFRQPFALFVAAPTTTTTTTAGPLSPPCLQPSKMSVSANYFLCRPFAWSAPLLVIISSFFATVKNYQPNLIMHTFFVWRDLHLSHCSKQNVRFFIVDWMMKSA